MNLQLDKRNMDENEELLFEIQFLWPNISSLVFPSFTNSLIL
jgi:hypothetical protein